MATKKQELQSQLNSVTKHVHRSKAESARASERGDTTKAGAEQYFADHNVKYRAALLQQLRDLGDD
jgi:hypothetical protein